ncbi:MAG: hypothetical protein WC505_01380 [Patescibacteria group bacterium]
MPNATLADRIKGGVVFEEKFIEVLAADIANTEEFTGLDQAKKGQILPLLQVMRDDSIRHRKILEKIAEKY